VGKLLSKLGDYIDGAKSYLVSALAACLWIAVRLHWIHMDEDFTCIAGLLVSGLFGFCRAVTWKPGGLSGAIMLKQPDGGTLVVKPPPPLDSTDRAGV
jgi:hypothetical protein